MNTINIGWECDDINNDVVGFTWPILSPFILRGYQLSLSLMAIVKPGFLSGGMYDEILFVASFLGLPAPINLIGPETVIPSNKGLAHSLHGGAANNQGGFCQAILKSYVAKDPVANAVNETYTMSGLNILVPKGATLKMFAGHAGQGPVDFECQGGLFCEYVSDV